MVGAHQAHLNDVHQSLRVSPVIFTPKYSWFLFAFGFKVMFNQPQFIHMAVFSPDCSGWTQTAFGGAKNPAYETKLGLMTDGLRLPLDSDYFWRGQKPPPYFLTGVDGGG